MNKHHFEEIKEDGEIVGKTAVAKKIKDGHPFWTVMKIPFTVGAYIERRGAARALEGLILVSI